MGTRWFNQDGLTVRFGTRAAQEDVENTTKFSTDGPTNLIRLSIPDMTALDTSANAVLAATGGLYAAGNYANSVSLPDNSLITAVRTITRTACTGTSSTFNIGTYTVSATTGLLVVDDVDSIVNTTDGTLSEVTTEGQVSEAYTGANLYQSDSGTSSNLVIVVTRVTAFTAGAVDFEIEYQPL